MDIEHEAEIIREVLWRSTAFEHCARVSGPVFNLMFRTVNDVDVAADLAQEALQSVCAAGNL